MRIIGKGEADHLLYELVAKGKDYRDDAEADPDTRIKEPTTTDEIDKFKDAVALIGKADTRHVGIVSEDTDFGMTTTAKMFGFVCATQCRGLKVKLELEVQDKWKAGDQDQGASSAFTSLSRRHRADAGSRSLARAGADDGKTDGKDKAAAGGDGGDEKAAASGATTSGSTGAQPQTTSASTPSLHRAMERTKTC